MAKQAERLHHPLWWPQTTSDWRVHRAAGLGSPTLGLFLSLCWNGNMKWEHGKQSHAVSIPHNASPFLTCTWLTTPTSTNIISLKVPFHLLFIQLIAVTKLNPKQLSPACTWLEIDFCFKNWRWISTPESLPVFYPMIWAGLIKDGCSSYNFASFNNRSIKLKFESYG